jgi:acetyl/propionyl-CoA carboxylase alpha subunit
MLAKLIAHGETRDQAIDRAAAALRGFPILGVRTNVPFLIKVIEHPGFRAGRVHTGFVDQHLAQLLEAPAPSEVVIAAAGFVRSAPAAASGAEGGAAAPDPWSDLTGWGRS